MSIIKKTIFFIFAIVMITALSAIVSSADNSVDNNSIADIFEGIEPDRENDPLYLKYSLNPTIMAPVSGSASLTHNSALAGFDKVYGVDVSYFQDTINWKKVKAAGIDFAIIRLGYRGYGNGALVLDTKFHENMKNAKAAGVKIGIYFFTQAITIAEAKQEANYCLSNIKGYALDMPIYIDMEEISYDIGRFDSAHLSYSAKTNICKAFCDTIKNAGYRSGVYASYNYFTYLINGPQLGKSYEIWLAHYNTYTDYVGEYQIWQYTGSGRVDGVNRTVDMNVLYMKKGPEKVTNLKASGNGTNVTLSWNSSFCAHGYAVYAKNIETGAIKEVAKTTATSKTLKIPFDKSRFFIKAYYNVGTKYAYSAYSTGVSAYKGALPEVTNVSVASANHQVINLSWDKQTYCDGYIVYMYNTATNKYDRLAKTTSNVASYRVTGLTANTAYRFAVRAYKTVSGKEVASGNFVPLDTSTTPPPVTNLKEVSTTQDSVTLSWDKQQNVTGYIVYRYYSALQKWVRFDKLKTNSNRYTFKNLQPGVNYKFAVRAYVTYDGTEYASGSYPTVLAYTRPEAVSGITSVSSTDEIKLSWTKQKDMIGYIVFQYTAGKWTVIKRTTSNTFTVTGLSQANTYWFTVKSFRQINGKETTSEKFNVYKTSTNPETVAFKVTPGSKKATLKWNKLNGATGYIAYFKTTANAAWKRIAVTHDTSVVKTGLATGKSYYFTVKAYRNYNGKIYNGKFVAKTAKIK
ncbi:MAG: fibronectin type III domain-containing protein [Ruminococcus sp.]|nr:fibronectin type III domain-containing protein [Ruminococcus sp.]